VSSPRTHGAPSRRTRIRRIPDNARYDRATIDAILDDALVAHLGFLHEGQPFVIPTLHARVGDVVYVHGSAASRTLRALAGGIPVCLTVTLLDGLVLARSMFEHSVNYRSVVVLGTALPVNQHDEKLRALEAFSEQTVPGRWADARRPSTRELRATAILSLPLDEASAKVRNGPPDDGDTPDAQLDVWAGVVPLELRALAPVPDPSLREGIPVPPYLSGYGE
jgi:nitroimidazol reductase NimA-like FMN-containing flavoprotein (pyridoxamine 5'-phosphate oxidase superfamily)